MSYRKVLVPLTREEADSMSIQDIIYTCLKRSQHPKDIRYWRKQAKIMERTKRKLEKIKLRGDGGEAIG